MTSDVTQRFDSATIAAVPTEDLRDELAQAIGITARSLAYLATIWAELQRRGEDLSALRGGGLFTYLPEIAAGRLLPELVVRCAGQAMLLRTLGTLPIEEQRRAMRDGITVASLSETGGIDAHQIPLEQVGIAEIRQALGAGYVRPVAQQVALLSNDRSKRTQPTGLRTITLRVTAAEHDAVVRRARAEGMRSPNWVAMQLRRLGLLTDDESQ
ncbi:hypothetical protein ACEYYA_01020 [Paracoccus sp. p3-h83]|uniref:hypothetical protein n=1 Tax=Paracoccus sp. p3-h83 TaxID=3342805 RepID=UPI0035B7E70F